MYYKSVLRSRNSQDIQYNGEQKKEKRANSGWLNTTQKTYDWATYIRL